MKAFAFGLVYGSLFLGLVNSSPPRALAQAIATAGAGDADSGPKIVVAPRPIVIVRPNVPKKARKKKNGVVQLQATVTVEGTLENLAVVSGNPDLAEASLVALRQWRYKPSTVNGVPVQTQHDITIIFPPNTDAVYLGPDDLSADLPLEPPDDIRAKLMSGEIVRIFKGLTPTGVSVPKGSYLPDPEYTETARKSKYQGTCVLNAVVAEDGSIGATWVVRPVGEGLDEKAIESVRRWKFTPATNEGKPIPALVTVEVSFHLQ